MDELRYDGWVITYDSFATREAYQLESRGAHDCQCACCRNYVAVRDQHYPLRFKRLLEELGIDPHKEAELSEMGPVPSGDRFYAGFYHFVGEVLRDPGDRTSDFAEQGSPERLWRVFFTPRRDLAFASFRDLPLVQLEFFVELPWTLPEPAES